MLDYSNVPIQPGCYIYKDSHKQIIYIGKAKSLKKRVASYFTKHDLDPKTAALVSQITQIDFIVTDSEKEALLLERNLVKKHQPKYNIDLKDSKRYAYIELTKEPYPRVLLSRARTDQGEFFGPFTSGFDRDLIIETINRHFQLRTCKTMPKRACLRYHLSLCPAPCIQEVPFYENNVNNARLILKGKTAELKIKLESDMKESAKSEDFERAKTIRDQIFALDRLSESQNMERNKSYNEDVIAYQIKSNEAFILIFNIYKGTLTNKKEFQLDYQLNFLEEFLNRYYEENPVPKEIIIAEPLSEALSSVLGCKITIPKQGEKRQLLDLAIKNLEISFFGKEARLEALKAKLKLNDLPRTIECFDISHLQGTSTVASMVQFRNGIPYKSNYRRYKITTVDNIDDFKSIAEVVRRRYARLIFEKAALPDLIVIDGGKGQLNAAIEELKKFNLKVPIISIAKREEEIFVPGLPYPFKLEKSDKALQLVQEIRDEAHRFAITYNRLLRSKKLRDKAVSSLS